MEIKEKIPLAQYTTLKIGGAARFFCEAKDEEEILEALEFAEEKNLPVFALGGGSNILISDKGFEGLVIRIFNFQFSIFNSSVECGAGVSLSKVVNESVRAGLTGLEWAAGVPGTVGGAIRGNAGCFGSDMSGVVESVRILETPNISKARLAIQGSTFPLADESANSSRSNLWEIPQGRTLKLRDCKFAYRDSIFMQNQNLIILSATLRLKKGDREESEKRIKEIIKQRKDAQPFDFPSSGSFFKNPIVKNKKLLEEYETDTGSAAKNSVVPAGYIIDALGIKGKKIGGAMVSQSHGNFLVNAGDAKAEDFIILAAFIKTRARNNFGVQLKEEVQMVGF